MKYEVRLTDEAVQNVERILAWYAIDLRPLPNAVTRALISRSHH
jgi:hypothetical protein